MNVNSYNCAFPFASYFETHCFHGSTRDFKASICSCILTCRITVQELADFLVQHGAVNALNLDGGGSTTFVLNGILANFPSDYWWVRPVLCECCRCFNQLHFFYFICLCVCLFVCFLLAYNLFGPYSFNLLAWFRSGWRSFHSRTVYHPIMPYFSHQTGP